jgi:DNA-binding transcriptional regulator LsrR (DeoR family)
MHLAMRAAWLRYRHGQSNAEIAGALNITPSYVSKLCDVARDSGWVRFTFMGPEEIQQETQLTRMLGEKLRYVRVVTTPSWTMGQEQNESEEFKAERDDQLGFAVARRLDALLEELHDKQEVTVAIGSSDPMYAAVGHIWPHTGNVRIVPTALTQVMGSLPRTNAQIIATLLASRLRVLPTEYMQSVHKKQPGELFIAWLGQPHSYEKREQFAEWHKLIRDTPALKKFNQIWSAADIVLLGVNAVSSEALHRYKDHHANLKDLGVEFKDLQKYKVAGTLAGRYIAENGEPVPLSQILPIDESYGEIEAIDLVMPTKTIRDITTRESPLGHTILVFGGSQGSIAASAFKGGWANSLICDSAGARAFIAEWRRLSKPRDEEAEDV